MPAPPSGPLHVALWVVQILLAALFGMAGAFKLTSPIPDLVAAGLGWAGDAPARLTRFVALSELLGAVGLLLPSALRIMPRLTPLAASGLVLVMVLALGMHVMRGELDLLAAPVVLGGLAAFVAWGRATRAPIQARG